MFNAWFRINSQVVGFVLHHLETLDQFGERLNGEVCLADAEVPQDLGSNHMSKPAKATVDIGQTHQGLHLVCAVESQELRSEGLAVVGQRHTTTVTDNV